MHKIKQKQPDHRPRVVSVNDVHGDDLIHRRQLFPLLEARAKEEAAAAMPPAHPANAAPQPSERALLRAATALRKQSEERTRRILLAADRPAPTVQEDLQAVRRRPLDAPMATRERLERQPPAGYRPPVRIDATRSMAVTVASIVMIIASIVLAAWLGQP